MTDFALSSPELQQIELSVYPIDVTSGEPSSEAVTVTQWTSYIFEGDYTTPTDAFHFTLGLDRPDDTSFRLRKIRPGAKCEIRISGRPQATGYIDAVEYQTSRSGGITVNVIGRDAMGRCVDANSDPSVAFKTGQTVEDFLTTLFAPYGFRKFLIDNHENRALQTGLSSDLKYSKAKKKTGKPLKSMVLHQLKPYHGEGLFAFAARVAHRHGIWLRPNARGDAIVATTPTFDGEPSYRLRRGTGDENNMLACSVRVDTSQQPTIIFADSFSGGGEYGKGRHKVVTINPSVRTKDPAQVELISKHRDARMVDMRPHKNPIVVPKMKPLFLHDDESKTEEQLERFLRRELSLLRKNSLIVRATVEGHGQLVDGQFVPWAVDTLVDFADEVSGIREPLWVLGRAFHKSQSGTTTELDLIRPYSMEF